MLSFAAYTDWKWRRAPNVLWPLLAGVATLLLAWQAAIDPAPWAAKWPYLLALAPLLLLVSTSTLGDAAAGVLGVAGAGAAVYASRAGIELTAAWPYLAGMIGFVALVYALHTLPPGLIAGGADAQALIAIGMLVPFPLAIAEGFPPLQSWMPGSFATLMNALLAAMLLPLALFASNAARGAFRFPHMLLGFRRRAADVQQGHVWPLEFVDADGTRRTRLFSARLPPGEMGEAFERIRALGEERIWVTPKVPFIIPILVGFVLAFALGDVLGWAMSSLLAR